LHLAVAPVGSVLPAAAVGAVFEAVAALAPAPLWGRPAAAAGAAVAGAAFVAAAGAAAGAAFVAAAGAAEAAAGAGAVAGAAEAAAVPAAFWMPPWPLQVPLPVDVEVVPSLQVVVAVESAQAGNDSANAIKGAVMSPTRIVFFMIVYPRVCRSPPDCSPIGVESDVGA
jgi:hypothetical protein